MSGRKHIGKKTRSQLNSTSVPNPLQRRRLKAPPQIQSGLSQQQDTPSIPEQLDRASQFNHNFLGVPVEALATAPPLPSIQGKVDQPGEKAIADTVESQEEELKAEEQTVEQEQISAGEGTENHEEPNSNPDQDISDSEKDTEIVQRQPEHSSLQGQVEKASRFNHNFLDVPVNGVGSSQLPIQRQVNFSNLEENSYPQEEVSPVDPVKNSLNLFKTQTIQSKESTEAQELEQKSPTETPPIENEAVLPVDPVRNSLNLFKTQRIQAKESTEAQELEQKSPTETPPIENEEVRAVDPVKNSLNLFKTQTIQRKESVEGEELEQKSQNEGDPIQMKGIEEQPSLEREMIAAPSEEETIGQEKELEAQQPKKLTSQPLEFTSNKEQPILVDNATQEEPLKIKTLAETSVKETFNKEHQLPIIEGQESKPNEAKKLAENSSEIPSNKEQQKLSEEAGETEPLKAKKLEPNPPQAEASAKNSQTNLNVKTVAGQTPTVPANQAKPEVGTQKGIAQTPAPGATPATQETASAGSAPAIASGGGSAEAGSEGAGEETEDDGELAEVAGANQQVELESSERDAAMASLAEGAMGGEAPAGGGGGGGGAAIADKPTPPVPEVSQSDPSAALAAVSNLPPAQLQAALGGVSAAVGNTVGKERAELAANPPEMASPGSATPTKEGSAADKSLPEGKTPKAVEKAPEGQAKPVPPPPPIPLPAKPPVANVPSPQVAGNAEGKLDSGDAQKLQASLRNLPTQDPSLEQVSTGSPPPLELAGDADPKQAQEQRTKLEKGVADAHTQGQQDLAQPMGENEIYPQVPQETLRAEGIGAGGAAGGGAAAKGAGGEGLGGAAGDDAVSIIAQQEKGSEIQAAVAKAQAEIAAKRQEHTTQVAQEKTRSNQEITRLQQENTTQQAQERAKAQGEVSKLRSDWQQEQDSLVQKSRTEADEAVSKGNQDVAKEQTEAEKQAAEHIKKGDEDAAVARRQGEEEAEKERQKGEQESGGILGWLADKAKAFFDGIKQAIQKAFEVARAAVKAAIEGAQKLATAVIEAGRKAIVGIIKAVGDVLIAIGDKLLAAFPELRDRFRNAIKSAVKVAEDAVNALANTLKKGVQAALNLLAKGLDAALGLLEKGMMAAVDLANQAVQGAIKFADAAIKAMAAFAVLVKDISGNPGQWLSNLGAGANDGIRNHFWGAFQTAVQEWFSQKVEEVLGLGMTVWNVLKQGGINTAEVGKMAWEGIKSAIPGVLIQILIEKVVSMIVPAAGTVIVIIEGLQAAWGTVSRILQAFERFMAFLKAVKTGQAGPPFGAALASAGVVVIDFVANWLLRRLRGPASKVAGKIKEIAKKIGKKVKKALKKVKQKLGKVKDKFFGNKQKPKGKKLSKEEAKQQEIQKRVDKAQRELPPKVQSLLAKKPSRLRVLAQFAIWRIAYKLSQFELKGKEGKLDIIAKVNPPITLAPGWTFEDHEIFSVLDRVASEYVQEKPHFDTQMANSDALTGRTELDPTSPATPTNLLNPGQNILDKAQNGNGEELGYIFGRGNGPQKHMPRIYRHDSPKAYPNYSTDMKSNLQDVDVGNIFTALQRGEKPQGIPTDKTKRAYLGTLYALWFGVEPSHPWVQHPTDPTKRVGTVGHKRDYVYSLMISELMSGEGNDKLSVPKALETHPSSFGGAQRGAKELTAYMNRPEEYKNDIARLTEIEKTDDKGEQTPEYKKLNKDDKKIKERYEREVESIKLWFHRHTKDLPAFNEKPTIKDVEDFVRRKLREYRQSNRAGS